MSDGPEMNFKPAFDLLLPGSRFQRRLFDLFEDCHHHYMIRWYAFFSLGFFSYQHHSLNTKYYNHERSTRLHYRCARYSMLITYFSVSVPAINLTVTVYAICQGITPSFFASLVDAYGRRPVLLGLISPVHHCQSRPHTQPKQLCYTHGV